MALNPRQQKFVQEYANGASGSEAARRAGYKGNPDTLSTTAHKLLTNADIRKRVEGLRKAAWNAAVATREERLAILSGMVRGEPHRVTIVSEGVPSDIDQLPSVSARVKAAELLAKMQGDFVEPTPLPPINNSVVIHLPTSPRRAS